MRLVGAPSREVPAVRAHLVGLLVAALVLTGLAAVGAPTAAGAATVPAPTGLTSDFGTDPNYTPRNPTLRWDKVAGATSYHVQIATDDSFSNVVYDSTTVGHQVTPTTALPVGTLYWRVAATTTGNTGPFQDASFAESWDTKPQLQSPTDYDPDNSTVPNPTALTYPDQPAVFSWTALDGAKSYTLQIDDAPDFIGAQSYTTPNTSYTLTDPQTVGQQFYWRVQASSGSAGVVSQWSDTRSYLYEWPSVPVMATPTDGSTLTDVVFSWDSVSGAKNYELQVSPNGDWTNNSTIDKTIVATSYTPPTPLDNGSYFWRVRSIDSAGHFGPWADPFSFTRQWVDRPVLQLPAYDSGTPNVIPNVGTDVQFRWSAARHAADYEIQFSVDQNFSQTVSCYTNHTEWTPYSSITTNNGEPGNCLLPTNPNVPIWTSGVTYYWRVRGLDGAIKGLWSGAGEFIRNPPAPQLSAPADGASVFVPTMSWSAVAGAEKYKVTLTSKSGSAVSGYPLTTYNTSVTPQVALTAAQSPYTWTVQAVDATGLGSVLPTSRQFSISATAPTQTEPALTLDAPAGAAASRLMPSFAWAPVTNAAKYIVHVAINGFEQTPLTSTDPYPAYAPAGVPLAAGTYTWWVEARDSSNTSLGTSSSSTFQVLPLDSLTKSDYLTPARCDVQTSCSTENDTPTFSWNPIPNAALYRVTIAADSHFTNVVREYTTAYTTLTPRESLLDSQAGQAYYWFVRPCFDALMTHCGPGSDDGAVNGNASAFRKRSVPAQPISPDSPSQVPDQITFRWQDYLDTENGTGASQEPADYHIQVATAADFAQAAVIDDQVVDSTSYTPSTATYPEGPLYWRVQAIDNSDNALTWSDPQGTTTGWLVTKASSPPQLDQPTAGAHETGVPFLTWHPQKFAATYTVEVYKNADVNASSTNLVTSTTTKFAAWSPTVGLPQGDYVWRVRRTDGGGKPGPWSAMRSFHLEQAAPTLTSPAAAAEINSSDLVFSWTPVAGASQYRWQLSQNPGFSPVSAQMTTLTSSWSPTTAISDGTWYWRVQVLDGATTPNVLATSASRVFTKDGTAPTVRAVAPTSAVSITPTLTATFSEPVRNVTAGTFQVTVAGTSSPVAGQVALGNVDGVDTATWQPLKPMMPGQSYTATLTSGITDDPAGNALTPKSWTFRTDTLVQNDSPAVGEHWDRDAASGALGGSYDASETAGSSASYTFNGTGISVLGTRMQSGGYAAVYLDGLKQTSTASFYSAKTAYRKVVWSKSGLAGGTHTVQVRVLGTKPAAASDRWVYLDGFQVGTSQVDQVNAAVGEAFARAKSSTASGGSYDSASHATNGDTAGRPSYSIQFCGTGVSVYAVKSKSAGKAAVYLDGKLKTTVDLRATSTYVTGVASVAGLTNNVHTLRIDVVGTKTGSGSAVGLDYVRIS